MLDLCEQLADLAEPHGAWVRLHYVYPYPHVDDILPLMATGRVLPYLDVPFQHSHPDVLRRMKRPASGEKQPRAAGALARDLPAARRPQHLHRRLSRRDRGRVRAPARLHARGAHRPRRLLRLLAGRRRERQRAARHAAGRACARSGARASCASPRTVVDRQAARARRRDDAGAGRLGAGARPQGRLGPQLRRRARDRRPRAPAAARQGVEDAEGRRVHARAHRRRRRPRPGRRCRSDSRRCRP